MPLREYDLQGAFEPCFHAVQSHPRINIDVVMAAVRMKTFTQMVGSSVECNFNEPLNPERGRR